MISESVRFDMASIPLRYTLRDPDRHGNMRIYFRRRKGDRKVRLRGEEGSEDFMAAYRAALAGIQAAAALPDARPEKPAPGSFQAASIAYFTKCAEFLALDGETRRVRCRIFESMWAEPIKPGSPLTFATCPLTAMTAKHIKVLRDRKASTPEAANSRLKALRKFFDHAFESEMISTNPAREVKRFKRETLGHHTWTSDEVRQYEARHPVGSKARLALALFAYTGLRISDVAMLGRQHAKGGALRLTLHKNRNVKPVVLELPILPELAAVIDASPAGDLTFLTTEYGRPFSIKGLGQKMRQWCDEAGLHHCSAHGVRKAGATIAAENGATIDQLKAIFGWSNNQQPATYTRAASQKKLAATAMHLVVPSGPEREQMGPTLEANTSIGGDLRRNFSIKSMGSK
jgi:integrase